MNQTSFGRDVHIRALDGFRAFAILLVIWAHCAHAFFAGVREPSAGIGFQLVRAVRGGWVGVDLFFVLSGFLIGRQLWLELRDHGNIRIGAFLLRRGFRIWPLYFCVLGASLLARLTAGHADAVWPEALFLSNYYRGSLVGGSWSLATEEQFYLTVPIALATLACFKISLRTWRWVLIGLIMVAPAIRWFIYGSAMGDGGESHAIILERLYYPFHTHFDGLVAGLFLSNISVECARAGRGDASGANRTRDILWTSGVCLSAAALRWMSSTYFDYSAAALIFAGLVRFCLRNPDHVVSTFLSWRVFHVVSKLSYGMYLLHGLALAPAVWMALRLPGLAPTLQFLVACLVAVSLSMLLASVTHALIEKPFLRLRTRFDARDGLEKMADA